MIYRLSRGPAGISARLVEQDPPPDGGYEFEEFGDHDADPEMLLDLVTVVAGTEMARRSLTRAGSGQREICHDEGSLAAEVVGRIETVPPFGPLTLVVDGHAVSWDELGQALSPYEGWQFVLRIDLQHGGAGPGPPAGGVGVAGGRGQVRPRPRQLLCPGEPARPHEPGRRACLRRLRGTRRGDLRPGHGRRNVPAGPGRPAASPFDRVRSAALRRQLKDPVRLVALTPLGTRAMRERMLAEGREAGLVGELAAAAPAEMLGVVAEHYTGASAAQEIARWREAHGGSLDPLLAAIDDCPFVTRRVALLQTLVGAVPEGPRLLADLSRDPGHRPVALLARRAEVRPANATPEEATWMMIGSMLELLELGGPEAVTGQLSQLPSGRRKELVRTVLASGFPVPETIEEFRTLVAAPILHGPPQPHTAAHVTRTQRTRPKRPRRH
jgi:hypothetical protein